MIEARCHGAGALPAAVGTAVVVAMAGCGQAGPLPVVVDVSPVHAYTDAAFYLRVGLKNVRPGVKANVGGGSLEVDLGSLDVSLIPDAASGNPGPPVHLQPADWNGTDKLWVKAPAEIATGTYALRVADVQGRVGELAAAFEALGSDPADPMIVVDDLGSRGYLGASRPVNALVTADDGLGTIASIAWETSAGQTGACPIPLAAGAAPSPRDPPASRLTCQADFMAPPLGADDPPVGPFSFRVVAEDAAGRQAVLELPLHVAKLPTVESFSDMVGGFGGYQPFIVRGHNFLDPTTVSIGDALIVGASPGGDRVSDELIVGWTPPHNRAEPLSVTVRSPAGPTTASLKFSYAPAPRPRDIQPPFGPTRGGILVTVRGNNLRTGVLVLVGSSPADRQPLAHQMVVSAEDEPPKIVGCLPPGEGPAIVWAYDPVTGDGELAGAFTYDDALAAAGPASDSCP